MRLTAKRSYCGLLLLVVIAAVGVVFSACGGGSGGGTAANDTGAISGQVTVEAGAVTVAMTTRYAVTSWFPSVELVRTAQAQNGGGVPLSGAVVNLVDANGSIVGSTTTDQNGNFSFSGITAGTYSIQVSDPTIILFVVTDVVVLAGDTAMIEGTVTVDGAVVNVDYELQTCGLVAESPGQLGHAQALADAAEISVDEVIAIREGNCLGWGVIAQQLQVSPGTLGLGNSGIRGGGRPEGAGPPEGVGGGRPEGAGPPEGVGGGRPDGAGPPEGVGSGRPDDAGPR